MVSNMKKITKNETQIIKGVAIVLMLMHHLFLFDECIYHGGVKTLFPMINHSLPHYFGSFGKICVSLYFFLGGYGLYEVSKKKKIDVLSRIKKLYIEYWKVFLIFVPIGFIFFSNQPIYTEAEYISRIFSNFNIEEFIKNLIGVSSSYNGVWWFFKSYIIALVSFPFIKKIINKKKNSTNLFICLATSIIITNVLPAIGEIKELGYLNGNPLYNLFFIQAGVYTSSFWLGMIMSEGDLLNKLNKKLKELNLFSFTKDLFVIMIITFFRTRVYGESFDLILVPFFILFSLDFILRFKSITAIFKLFGKHSTNMWLTHTFFSNYYFFFVKIVMFPRYSIPCLILLVLFSLSASFFTNFVWKVIINIINKIKSITCEIINREPKKA